MAVRFEVVKVSCIGACKILNEKYYPNFYENRFGVIFGDNIHGRYTFKCDTEPDCTRLKVFLKYLGVNDYTEAVGKDIMAVVANGRVCGFGHLTEDKFVPLFTNRAKEVTYDKFKHLYLEQIGI